MNQRGQFSTDVGNVIALIILIAIGAFVTYSVTGSFDEDTQVDDVTVENSGTGSVDVQNSAKEATITTEYSGLDNSLDNLTVTLNGSTVLDVSGSLSDATVENTVTDLIESNNTLDVVRENTDTSSSTSATLETTTYAGSAVSNVEEKGGTSFNLMTILVIVIIAAVIIGVVLRALAGRGNRTGGPAPAY